MKMIVRIYNTAKKIFKPKTVNISLFYPIIYDVGGKNKKLYIKEGESMEITVKKFREIEEYIINDYYDNKI